MAISKKANLLKKANELEIPTFGNPSVAELERRLNDWRPGKGWVVRRLHQKALPEWAGDNIPHKSTLWMPNTSCEQVNLFSLEEPMHPLLGLL